MINDTIINNIGLPEYQLSYIDVLNSLGAQVTDRFLYIGLFTIAFSLWIWFDGHKREDERSQMITVILNSLALVSGLTSLVFYTISKGMIQI